MFGFTTLYNYLYPYKLHKYGWFKGEKYNNIKKFSLNTLENMENIKTVDLRKKCPEVYDQGQLGSCTANSLAFIYEFDELKQNEKDPFIPSRLFIYYNERNMEGNVKTDAGAEIHDGVTCINKIGVCTEIDWPYDISKFTDKPPSMCYKKAQNHKSLSYQAINQDIDQIKIALIQGYPVSFGFTVYESFETQQVASTGIMPMPKDNEKILGGHAVAVVGFIEDTQMFIIRNSWGNLWGDKGYFYMPYDFIKNKDYASDFWIINKIIDNIL